MLLFVFAGSGNRIPGNKNWSGRLSYMDRWHVAACQVLSRVTSWNRLAHFFYTKGNLSGKILQQVVEKWSILVQDG